MKPTIIIHKTCASSYNLYKLLKERGLLDKVTIVEAGSPVDREGRLVWSVPWLLVGGEPAGTDPLPLEAVIAAIEGDPFPAPKDRVSAFMEAVLHSALAASMVLVNGSLKPVMDIRLAKAAVHAPLSGADARALLEEVKSREKELLEEWMGKISRAVAISFVREAWWSSGGALSPSALEKLVEAGGFKTWLIGKASIGRAGLPADPRAASESDAIAEAEQFIIKTAPVLIRRVAKEQDEILGDEEWMMA